MKRKQPHKSSTQNAQVEKSTPSTSNGKQPVQENAGGKEVEQPLEKDTKDKQLMPPPPIPLVHYNDRTRKQADEPSPKKPAQENPKGRTGDQPLQANKGTQTEQRRPQQSVQTDRKGKQVEQPKQPRPEQSVETDLKRKQVEQAVAEYIRQRSKQTQRISIELLNDPTAKGKEPETVTFTQRPQLKSGQQPSPYQFGQIEPKGKGIEQAGQADLTIRSRQLPHLQSGQVEPKGKQIEQPGQDTLNLQKNQPREALTGKPKQRTAKGQQSQEMPLEELQQSWPQRNRKLRRPDYLGHQKVYITRIPCSKNGKQRSMHRVQVAVISSMGRHPQTLLFKNIPDVEYYWTFLNDKATSAQRIVRLEREGKPTPYFLLACRGEWPEKTSPRNDHAIFADLDEPKVFNDAFVFKLGEPETYGEGYAKYVHIEKDLGSVDWTSEAIRNAAMKVESATLVHANPGFQDPTRYADPETMSKDLRKMRQQFEEYKKAEGKGDSVVTPERELWVLENGAIKSLIRAMIKLLHWVRTDALPPIDEGRELSNDEEVPLFIGEAIAAFSAIRDHDEKIDAARNADDAPPASAATADQKIAVLLLEMEMSFCDLVNKVIDTHEMMETKKKKSVISGAMTKVFSAFLRLRIKVDGAFENEEVAQRVDAAREKDTVGSSGTSSELPVRSDSSDIFRFTGGGPG